jgi:myo-inositol-1(or 4)-monophosphatase
MGLKPWDTAAGTLLITEAGGRVGTLSGDDYKQEGHIIAGTPKVYLAMVQLLQPLIPAALK